MVAASHDSAAPESQFHARHAVALPTVRGVRLALLLAWAPVLVLGLLATVDAFALGDTFAVAAWTSGLWMLGLTMVVGLRDLREAEARTGAALDRAIAAETVQRARADELAAILRASEGLVLTGEGKLDFMGILAALTPAGSTSYLAQVEGVSESLVVAAHGPLAPWVIGLRKSVDTGADDAAGRTSALTSYSATGHVVGTAAGRVDLPGMDAEIAAALSVRLVDHSGHALGWLNLLDPQDERVLEPTFVNLAQLVANQIGVAMENQALLARVQHQLLEVQRVQQQLVRVTKLGAVGELAAAVAHEVNNPLTGILGFSELLLGELPADDPRHQEASIIQAEAVRARGIIRSLLEFARPRPPQRIPSDVNDLVKSTLELLRFRAGEAGIWIAEDYGEVPSLEVDPDALKQVLLNLFNNAVAAMPRGGRLRVTTRTVDDRVGVIVADSGVGMDAQTRGRIFTPFFSTRAGAGGGTGLGLSVSLQIVEGHGGTIDVYSEPGKGAEFTVWLPISTPVFDGSVIVPGTERTSPARSSVTKDGESPDADREPVAAGSGSGPGHRTGTAA
jgi:signal transduction histidine kinase